jgi:hypothetical protein
MTAIIPYSHLYCYHRFTDHYIFLVFAYSWNKARQATYLSHVRQIGPVLMYVKDFDESTINGEKRGILLVGHDPDTLFDKNDFGGDGVFCAEADVRTVGKRRRQLLTATEP